MFKHLNVHSLAKEIDKLKQLIQFLHQKKIEVDAILLCKTFLHSEAWKSVQIPNFSLSYNKRENTTDGGLHCMLR